MLAKNNWNLKNLKYSFNRKTQIHELIFQNLHKTCTLKTNKYCREELKKTELNT